MRRPPALAHACACPRCAATGRPAAPGPVNCEQGLELLARPPGLALRREVDAHEVAQVDEHLDVEGGVPQPRLGQRPRRPVDGGVLLGQRQPEVVLDHGGEPDPRQPEQTPRELGVEELSRAQADLGQARQVLGRGVQDPLGAADRLVERGRGPGRRSGR